jgi:hypothetical protein
MYSSEWKIDPKAINDWPAKWIYMENQDEETGYWEIDIMEKFNGDDVNHITITMHFSYGEKNDGMMHNCKYRIKNDERILQSIRFCDDGKITLSR